nr:hypothetical protein Iba_chr12aCG12780 [Ipomoea batatas]
MPLLASEKIEETPVGNMGGSTAGVGKETPPTGPTIAARRCHHRATSLVLPPTTAIDGRPCVMRSCCQSFPPPPSSAVYEEEKREAARRRKEIHGGNRYRPLCRSPPEIGECPGWFFRMLPLLIKGEEEAGKCSPLSPLMLNSSVAAEVSKIKLTNARRLLPLLLLEAGSRERDGKQRKETSALVLYLIDLRLHDLRLHRSTSFASLILKSRSPPSSSHAGASLIFPRRRRLPQPRTNADAYTKLRTLISPSSATHDAASIVSTEVGDLRRTTATSTSSIHRSRREPPSFTVAAAAGRTERGVPPSRAAASYHASPGKGEKLLPLSLEKKNDAESRGGRAHRRQLWGFAAVGTAVGSALCLPELGVTGQSLLLLLPRR